MLSFILVLIEKVSIIYKIITKLNLLIKNPFILLISIAIFSIFGFYGYKEFIIYKNYYTRKIIDNVLKAQVENQIYLSAINKSICTNNLNCYAILVTIVKDKWLIVRSVLYNTQIILNNKLQLDQIDATKLSREHCDKINCEPIYLTAEDLEWLTDTIQKNNVVCILKNTLYNKQSFKIFKDSIDKQIYGYIVYPIYLNNKILYYVGVAVNQNLFEKFEKNAAFFDPVK